ncbi:DUF104 domain-containing protein [Desulfobacterales bacterium HSG17]|nr:DUF104 domain-containing protein [Desulfobacterales bacterium HSG17]
MPETITATYKNGSLHPLSPLNLPDNEAVRIIILPGEPPDEKNEIIRIMSKAGLIRPSRQSPHTLTPDPVSEKERMRIAKKLGQARGKPLSEIIISERDL